MELDFTPLTREEIDAIAQYPIAALSNGLDLLGARPLNKGFMNPAIHEIIPRGKTYVGYAATAKISCDTDPGSINAEANYLSYCAHVQRTLRPSISVVQDIDPLPVGALWGELNVLTHKALGCVAVVTNGGIRDLDELDDIDFGLFGGAVVTARAKLHIIDYNCTIQVGGLEIHPLDLLAADRHGVITIPHQFAHQLAEATRLDFEHEKPLIDNVREVVSSGKELDLKDLARWRSMTGALYAAGDTDHPLMRK